MALRQDEEWVYTLPLAAQHCSPSFLGSPGQYSRQDGGERDHLGSQVRHVGQEEDEERLDDAHALGEPRDQGQQEGKEQPHGCAPQAHQEEGGWREEKCHLNHKKVGPAPVLPMLHWPSAMLPPRSPPKHPMEHKALVDPKASPGAPLLWGRLIRVGADVGAAQPGEDLRSPSSS